MHYENLTRSCNRNWVLVFPLFHATRSILSKSNCHFCKGHSPQSGNYYLSWTAPASRAWNLEEARSFMRHAGLKGDIAWTFDEALKQVEDAATVVVTGSFHTVGDAMARLHVSPFGS